MSNRSADVSSADVCTVGRVVVGPEAAGTNEPGTGERLWPVQGLSYGPCRLSKPVLLTTLISIRRHTGQVPELDSADS